MSTALRTLAVTLAGAALLLTSQPAAGDERELARLREREQDVENLLLKVQELFPSSVDESEAKLRRRAKALQLDDLQIRRVEGPPHHTHSDGGTSSLALHHVEITGSDSYDDVQRFLRRVDQTTDRIRSVRIEACNGDRVDFAARLELPLLSLPPSRDPVPAVEQETARLRFRSDALVSILKAMKELRERTLLRPLAVLEGTIREHSVSLSEVTLGEETLVRGILVGTGARTALIEGLAMAGFTDIEPEFKRIGVCQRFSIKARTQEGPSEDGLKFHPGSFGGGAEAVCEQASDAPRSVRVRGAATEEDESRMVLRLNGVELTDLFFALHDLTGVNLVVDGDVKGRVNVEAYEGITVDELFGELPSAGVVIGPGPLRRVSRPGRAPSPGASSAGGPADVVNMMVTNAEVPAILCAIAKESKREIRLPRDLRDSISVFSAGTPLDELLDGVIASAGLTSTIDGAGLSVGHPGRKPDSGSTIAACEWLDPENWIGSEGLSDDRWFSLRVPRSVDAYGFEDLTLAGVARIRESWRAYVYIPSRKLVPVEEGQRLLDATIRSVEPEGLTFATERHGLVEARFPNALPAAGTRARQ